MDSYGEEVTVPPNVPGWLWGGDRAHWHPNIRVRCAETFSTRKAAAAAAVTLSRTGNPLRRGLLQMVNTVANAP